MKNTERKDLGDHLSIYPKNMFDEAIKEKSQRRERLNLDPGESRVRQGRKWGLFGRHPAKSLPNQQKPEEERSEEQDPSGDVEKSKLGCDGTIAETRWKEEGDFTSEGVRIIHTGGENGQNGVAVLVEEKIARSIVEIERYGSRMIKVKIKAEPVDIVIIQVYMPTTNHEEEEVENMYERLDEVLARTKGTDYVVIMGDWNAVVGEGADGKSIGKYGLGKRNNRGEKLTELCNRRELVITNTWFQHEKRRRYTWKAPGDVARFQLDYILVKQRYRNSVKNAKAMPGADADTDHNLVITRAQIKLKFIKRKKTIKHRWNNKNMKERSNELGRKIEENLTESEGNSTDERWKRLKENIIESAMDIVGAEERMPAWKPWITKEMVDEMEERRKWKHQSTDKAR